MKRTLLLAAVIVAAWVRPLEADLPGYDDAYYARKALEVTRSGDWIALPFNGAPTFDNPPLGIWVQALAFMSLGPSDAAARLPTGLFGVLLILLAFEWGREVSGERWAGFLVAALILCNPLFLKYLRRAMLDVPLLFWSLLGVYLAQRKPLSKPLHALSGAAFGLACLTKSVLGLVAPLGLLAGWGLGGWRGRWRLKHWWMPSLGGFALVLGPWLGAMLARFGSAFINGHFRWLVWREGVGGTADGTRADTLARLFILLLPLSALFLAAIAHWLLERASSRQRWQILSVPLSWSGVGLILLAGIGPRKLWYFLVILPGLAATAAAGASGWTRRRQHWRRVIFRGIVMGWCIASLAVVALPVPLHRDRTEEIRALAAEARARTAPESPVSLYFPGEPCRWEVRNAFLWYADRPIQGCTGIRDELPPEAASGRKWILTSRAGLDRLRATDALVLVWSRRGDLVLATLQAPRTPPAG